MGVDLNLLMEFEDVLLSVIVLATLGWNLAQIILYACDRSRKVPIWPLIVLPGAAYLASAFWRDFQDIRPLTLAVIPFTAALIRWSNLVDLKAIRTFMSFFSCLTIFGTSLGLLLHAGVGGCGVTDEVGAVQPGGNYTAVAVYDCEAEGTYLALRPNRLALTSIFDYPDRRFAFYSTGFGFQKGTIAFHWDSSTHLSVLCQHINELNWKTNGLHEIGVQYRFNRTRSTREGGL